MDTYDLAVIGGGSAGLTAATIGGRVGARTILIDRTSLGGDCLHHGCVPSKALIKSASVAHAVRHAADYGISAQEPVVDLEKVMAHVRSAIETVGVNDSPEAMRERGVEVALGGARFLSPTSLMAGDREIRADNVIVSVGSRAFAPPIPGLEEAGFIDHISLFDDLRVLPPRLVVIGGGPIGVEMGQAMARLGSRVTIIEGGPRVLMRDDAELAVLLLGYLREELDVLTGSRVKGVSAAGGVKTVVFERDGKEETIECDEILVAVGRRPNLESLDLDRAGVRTNERGIIVDDALRTSAKNVWACGDCVGSYQFTHFAEAQARVAARNALFKGAKAFKETWIPWTTFSSPELAHVGLNEEQARAQAGPVHVYRFEYEELDRAVCDGTARGLAKIVTDRGGHIIGASLLGPLAGEAITEILVAMKAGMTLEKLAQVIHVYPTMNRIVRRVADQPFLEKGVGEWTKKLFGRFKGRS
ncbi:MAG: FAD-dependent oxidoreductase [Deltaproteobacteria bacterium]|nr:FAD-dependent oxidoreductase [Deltaproteobacteria bacterium]